jgi:hypothetical protein
MEMTQQTNYDLNGLDDAGAGPLPQKTTPVMTSALSGGAIAASHSTILPLLSNLANKADGLFDAASKWGALGSDDETQKPKPIISIDTADKAVHCKLSEDEVLAADLYEARRKYMKVIPAAHNRCSR